MQAARSMFNSAGGMKVFPLSPCLTLKEEEEEEEEDGEIEREGERRGVERDEEEEAY